MAALLAGDLPHTLVEHAEQAGVELLPFGGELATRCTCEPWADPCHHALAVLQQLTWLIEADPFVLIALRGVGRDDLLARVHRLVGRARPLRRGRDRPRRRGRRGAPGRPVAGAARRPRRGAGPPVVSDPRAVARRGPPPERPAAGGAHRRVRRGRERRPLDTNADDEHDPEGHTIAFERAQVDALVRQARDRLAEVDAALARLDAGSYGVCERCGGPVGDGRLEARPETRLCIDCARRS